MSTGIVTQGIGPGSSVTYFLTLGLDIAEPAVIDLIALTLGARSVDATLGDRSSAATLGARNAGGTLGSRSVAGTLGSRGVSLTVPARD